VLALAAGAAAQTAPFPPAKKKQRSARAVALIEWHKDAKGALAPRVVPIAFLWEGRYYDAGLYEASPRPMALEPGTVYEATRSGVPAGLFTVRGAAEVKGIWYGDGIWKPGATLAASSISADDERPRLSRAGAATTSTSPTPAAETPASSATQPEAYDPNRPVLHRGKPAAAKAAPPPPSPSSATQAASASPPPKPKPAAQSKLSDKPEALVAVSDEQTQEARPYLFPWTREEEERLTEEVKTMAEAAVAHEAGGAKPALDQVRVRAFDLNTDNLAEIVLSARATVAKASPKGRKAVTTFYYVTVVARMTASGDLRKLFSSVTVSAWLGSVPRMELVDAVDADGDTYGELLFALIGESSRAFVIYRVGRDELFKLIETGPMPSD
jgi:hypothetical protein